MTVMIRCLHNSSTGMPPLVVNEKCGIKGSRQESYICDIWTVRPTESFGLTGYISLKLMTLFGENNNNQSVYTTVQIISVVILVQSYY